MAWIALQNHKFGFQKILLTTMDMQLSNGNLNKQ